MAPTLSRPSSPSPQQRSPMMVLPVPDARDGDEPASGSVILHQVPYEEPRVQQDANYQVQWSNWMSDGPCYKYISVLLISWHPACDDMAVDEEVQRLKFVFETTYNYDVETIKLNSTLPSLPQQQANYEVASFVQRKDNDDTLFIIYYAGHGSPGNERGQLRISGRSNEKGKNARTTHIIWNDVEINLKTTRAHILQIFDCCYSGDLGRDSVLNERCYECLAANTGPYTRKPGKNSFTSALIWSLEKLAQPQSSPRGASERPLPFTTSHLAKTISECPDFPDDHKPSLTFRDTKAWHQIILAPLPRQGDVSLPTTLHSEVGNRGEDLEDNHKPLRFCVNLTFDFKHNEEEIERDLIKGLADHLKKLMLVQTSLRKVHWGGISTTASDRWRRVNTSVLKQVRDRRRSHGSPPVLGPLQLHLPQNNIHSDLLSPKVGQFNLNLTTDRTPPLSDTASDTSQTSEGNTKSEREMGNKRERDDSPLSSRKRHSTFAH